jgi:hypothetical protein
MNYQYKAFAICCCVMTSLAYQMARADEAVVQYVLKSAEASGHSLRKADLMNISPSEEVIGYIRQMPAVQTLEACKNIEIYSSEAIGLKMLLVQRLGDVDLENDSYRDYVNDGKRLLSRWNSELPPLDQLGANFGVGIISALSFSLTVIAERYEFRSTLEAVNKARDEMVFLIVEFPSGSLRTVKPPSRIVDELLKGSVPEKLRGFAVPLGTKSYLSVWPSEAGLNAARAELLEGGALIYVYRASQVLAALAFWEGSLVYYRNRDGLLTFPLRCEARGLVELLRKGNCE